MIADAQSILSLPLIGRSERDEQRKSLPWKLQQTIWNDLSRNSGENLVQDSACLFPASNELSVPLLLSKDLLLRMYLYTVFHTK